MSWSAVAAAAVFIWLGMVLAISFPGGATEVPRPGVTIQLGLGIGRLVFPRPQRVRTGAGGVDRRRPGDRQAQCRGDRRDAGGHRRPAGPAIAAPAWPGSDAVLADAAQAESGRSNAHSSTWGLKSSKVVALLVGGIPAAVRLSLEGYGLGLFLNSPMSKWTPRAHRTAGRAGRTPHGRTRSPASADADRSGGRA